MSNFYLEENKEFTSVLKARAKRKELEDAGLTPSNLNTLYKLAIDQKTMMYFRTKEAKQNFIEKHRNIETGKYDFMTRLPIFEGEQTK
ncbi:MAG: hypothetical protein ACK5KL_02595 [Dysgonomonas sp.]